MMARAWRFAVALALLLLLSPTVPAEVLGPGEYSGMVLFDRWDGAHLYRPPYVRHISEEVKERLRGLRRHAVTLRATEVNQPMNPGDACLMQIEAVRLIPRPDTALSGVDIAAADASEPGGPPAMRVELGNTGIEPVELHAEGLSPLLLVKRQPGQFAPTDGPSTALISRQPLWDRSGDGGVRPAVEGMQWSRRYAWRLENPEAATERFVLRPGGTKQFIFRFELEPGEYDFVFGYTSRAGVDGPLVSNPVAFDVVEGGGAPAVTPAELAGQASVAPPPDDPSWYTRVVSLPPRPDDALLELEAMDGGGGELPDPLPREAALQLLLSTEVFADATVGFAGDTSKQVIAFRALLQQPDASSVFLELLRRGRAAGELYALCGLYLTDPAAFNKEVEAYRDDQRTVVRHVGCVLAEVPVKAVIESERTNPARLRPGQTLRAWWEEHPGETAAYDVVGGAMPVQFAGDNAAAPAHAAAD